MGRSIEEIEKDIVFVKEDIELLRKMGATTVVALEDLYELYRELDAAKEAVQDAEDTL